MGLGGPPFRGVVLGSLALGAIAVVLVVGAVSSDGADGRPATFLPPLAPHPVAGQFEADGTTLGECSEQACVEQAFGNIAFRRGPKAALALFARRIAEDDAGCHRIAHTIGAASLARFRGNVARTFAEGTSSCWSGYYHGVLERSLLGVRSYTRGSLAKVARRLCADPTVREVTWLAYQCLHGLGHGLMLTTGYDLRRSLDVCRRLPASWDAEACKGGAFMENISPMYGATSRWLRNDDPLYPCPAVVEADRYECYKRSTTRMLMVIGFDWERMAELCSSLRADWKEACFVSFGRDTSAQNERDADQIIPLCELARRHAAERVCIQGAAMDITANDASGARATVLCNALEPRLRGVCYRAIGMIAGRFHRTDEEREADCRALAATARDLAWCLRGSLRSAELVDIA
ncbi:MAG: hypothetical protein ACRDPZ_12380 [Gaiellaceae bacterium]